MENRGAEGYVIREGSLSPVTTYGIDPDNGEFMFLGEG